MSLKRKVGDYVVYRKNNDLLETLGVNILSFSNYNLEYLTFNKSYQIVLTDEYYDDYFMEGIGIIYSIVNDQKKIYPYSSEDFYTDKELRKEKLKK